MESKAGVRAAEAVQAAWAMAKSVVCGRYSRGAWFAATLVYIGAISLATLPLATFLWTSPKPLRDIYTAFVLVAACLGLAGFILAYAKRLQDQNLNGLWAVVPLLVVPWILIWAGMTWGNHAWEVDKTASSSDYINIAATVSLIAIVVVGLRAPREAQRFGPRTEAGALLSARHPGTLLLVISAGAVAATSIYAGLLQNGIWVRRAEHEYDTGTISMPNNGGRVFATCGGTKGVSAIAQDGPGGGFTRDAIVGSWMFSVLPDGSLDILSVGKNGAVSYQSDGFRITAQGLKMDAGRVAADVEGFQLIGTAEEEVGDVRAVTAISFVKREHGYQATIAASKIYGRSSMMVALGGPPRASSFLMIADCFVMQASPVKP